MNLSGLSDEKVALHVQKNEGAGIEEIIDRYQGKLTRYVIGLVKDEAQAGDVIQETFIAVYKNINSFDADRKFSSWIYRIAHNKAINEIRKNNIFTSLEKIKEVPDEKLDAGIIQKNVDAKKMKEVIEEAVDGLPIKYREVMLLRYFEEKSYEEVSDVLRIPVNTVGVRIKRGLEALKKKLNINPEDYLS